MAKKIFTQSTADERIARTEAYAESVRKQFNATVTEILKLKKDLPKLDDGVMYSFDGDSVKIRNQVAMLLKRLHASTTMTIQKGIKAEWGIANKECDDLISQAFGKHILESNQFRAWTSHNTTAMNAFVNRSDAGMNLSDRVWNTCRQLRDELEIAMTVGIGSGESASGMSRVVRQCLNDPDLMFRRFRYKKGEDADGNPIWGRKWKKRVIDPVTGKTSFIDYDRGSYIPKGAGGTSRGVYKSAYKNAMRMTRTETNMAYRRADFERWQKMDFVLGIRIEMSHQHPKPDICDAMEGDYPKEFYFGGWHPHCFCYAKPILVSEDEMVKVSEEFLKGNEYTPKGKKITDTPQSFKNWVSANQQRILNAKSLPYWVKDNPLYVDATQGIALTPRIKPTRQADAIMEIRRRWAESRKIARRVDKIYADMPDVMPEWVNFLGAEIDACQSVADVDTLLFRSGVTKRSNYGDMRLEDVKTVAKVAAEMHKRFGLKSFTIKTETMRSKAFMAANGDGVTINAKYWGQKNIKGTTTKEFDNCAGKWVEQQKAEIKKVHGFIKQCEDYIAKNPSLKSYYDNCIKKYEKFIKEREELLKQGVFRHNVFLSGDTMLRDCFTHEMGHVVHDQIMGAICGKTYQRKRFQFGDNKTNADALDKELTSLFRKQKGDRGFLSEYGGTDKYEFLAESVVLYMRSPEKLPQSVLKWFESAEELASGHAIVKVQKASRKAALEEYRKRRAAEEKVILERLAERRRLYEIAEKQATKVFGVAQKFPLDIDLTRLDDLMRRRQYTKMGEEAAS